MNLVRLSEEDLKEVYTLSRCERFARLPLEAFHENYSPFFLNHTKSVATSAGDYLQGQLFTKQEMNMTQFVREVPDSDYEAMQHFISDSPWDDNAIISNLKKDVLTLLGDSQDGALIIDESGIEKQGKMSVGVARQYCGRLGKVENCSAEGVSQRSSDIAPRQVGVYLAYANSEHTSLIDYRLYLPEPWISDTERRKKCGVPDEVSFQTKAQLALEMIRAFSLSDAVRLQRYVATPSALPFSWVNMDCHYGEQPWLLKKLDSLGLCYIAEIPSDTRIFLNLPKTEIPPRKGNRGRRPTKKKLKQGEALPIQVRHFADSLDPSQWTTLTVRKTERGWLMADFAAFRVWHSVDNLPQAEGVRFFKRIAPRRKSGL